MTFVPNGRRHFGVSPSIDPDIAIQDLRHPNPVRPVFPDLTRAVRAPARRALRSYRALGGPLSFLAAQALYAAVNDQRNVVEDR
jgi:hypothetical protein